ncbi:MAG TPA: MATE family efflux transporter [Labilithrix sp.]
MTTRPPLPPLRREIVAIVGLAAPIAVAQLGLVGLGLVEVAIMGHAAPEQLGGASIGRSIGFLALAPGFGAAAALEPLAAQAVGAREPRTAWSAFVATSRAAALVSIPCAAFAIASTWLLAPLGVAPEIVAPARAFVVAMSPGFLLATLYLSAKAYLQAYKRTVPAIVAAAIANAANVLVCGALVLGDDGLARWGLPRVGIPALGAFGAGIANTFANGVLAVCVLVPALRLRPHDGAAGAEVPVARVLRLGMPIGMQLLAEIGVFSFVAILAGRLGNVAVSAHQIAIGLASFTFMGALGISGATAVRVGHAVGDGRSPRTPGLIGIALGAAFMSCMGIVFVSMPRALAFAFTSDPAIGALAEKLLYIAAAFQLFDGVQCVASGALRGAGDVRFPFVASVGAYWLVGFPAALVLGFALARGAQGLWWGLLIGLAVVAALLASRFVVLTRKPIARV